MLLQRRLGVAVDHRADIGRRIGGIAEAKLGGRAGDHREHRVGDVLLHEEDAAGGAALAGRAEGGGHHVVGDLLGQRRRVGDHGVDAAGLGDQRHDRAVLGGERAVDLLADLGRAGEGDAGDARIVDQRRADRAVAGDEMERVRRACPPRCRSCTASKATSGVCSAGLATTVLPAASAAATWPVKIASGKFHGLMQTKTPRPRRR